jgi:hypothetical protein
VNILQQYKSTIRRQFFRFIQQLQPWVQAKITWPSIDEWIGALSNKFQIAFTLFLGVDRTVIKV